MTVHLTKIAYGSSSIADLEAAFARRSGPVMHLQTRHRPKRADDMVGASLFWIIGNQLVVRSPIVALQARDDGRTDIVIERRLIPVYPQPKRVHQGWRYLEDADAPRDLSPGAISGDELPPALAQDLAALGLV